MLGNGITGIVFFLLHWSTLRYFILFHFDFVDFLISNSTVSRYFFFKNYNSTNVLLLLLPINMKDSAVSAMDVKRRTILESAKIPSVKFVYV